MIFLIKAIQLFAALSILVLVHEFGHFLFAKIFGIRVDKFYLFFDAGGFSLFKFKPKGSDTEYGIGWLPLGGYCKISGMIDESMDKGFLKNEPQPWEFRSKPAWQRLLVMFGGVLFNFILAIVLYIGILAIWGDYYVENEGHSVYVNELAYDMGFRTGDRILKFDDYVPTDFMMLQADMARRAAAKATVLRDGDTLDIYLDQKRLNEVLNTPGMFSLALPFVVDSIAPGSPNVSCGILAGDRVIAVNGVKTDYLQDSMEQLHALAGSRVPLTIVRGGDTLGMEVQVDTTGRIGVYIRNSDVKKREYTVLKAVPAGFKLTFSTIGGYIRDLKLVFTPSTGAYKSVGSFISMGQVFPAAWDWYRFVNILALFSIMLAVLNILPIPALDGGHIMFVLYEMITGKKPGDRFLEIAQIIGLLLLFALIVLAFGNDISRLIR